MGTRNAAAPLSGAGGAVVLPQSAPRRNHGGTATRPLRIHLVAPLGELDEHIGVIQKPPLLENWVLRGAVRLELRREARRPGHDECIFLMGEVR